MPKFVFLVSSSCFILIRMKPRSWVTCVCVFFCYIWYIVRWSSQIRKRSWPSWVYSLKLHQLNITFPWCCMFRRIIYWVRYWDFFRIKIISNVLWKIIPKHTVATFNAVGWYCGYLECRRLCISKYRYCGRGLWSVWSQWKEPVEPLITETVCLAS